MDPRKNFKPSHDRDDRDRDGPSSGVNQVNPHDLPRNREDGAKGHQGGDPDEVRPHQLQPNRDRQPDGRRDLGFDADDPREIRRRGKKVRNRGE
jgi:hypothetical protein